MTWDSPVAAHQQHVLDSTPGGGSRSVPPARTWFTDVPLSADLHHQGVDVEDRVHGVEGPGLPDHLRSGPSLRIPMEPGVESLNAATAAAIALYAWRQTRARTGVE